MSGTKNTTIADALTDFEEAVREAGREAFAPARRRLEALTPTQFKVLVFAPIAACAVVAVVAHEPGVMLAPVVAWFAPRLLRRWAR